MKIPPVEGYLFRADGQADTKKISVAFRNFARAPKYCLSTVSQKIKLFKKNYMWKQIGTSGVR